MKAVIQRVLESQVCVAAEVVGAIGPGLMVLLGVGQDDTMAHVDWLAEKLIHLRIFEDRAGRMNRSRIDVGGQMLIVSQFTLLGDCRKGRRPSFVAAAPPETAEKLYAAFAERVRQSGITVQTGRFRANMQVSLINEGPVTLIVETPANLL